MFKSLKKPLSGKKIDSIQKQVIAAAEAGDNDASWNALQPLLRAQAHQERAARTLVQIVNKEYLAIDRALEVLSGIYEGHADNDKIVASIGAALQSARDIDQLNAEPPDHPLFLQVVDRLTSIARKTGGANETEEFILDGLATAARMVARQRDDVAEESYRRLVEIDPDYAPYHYNLGLFYKTRGRFREGMLANQQAASRVDEPVESYQWNLGICATGAGEGAVALDVWKRMGQKIEMGRFDLPEGGYPQCKVRLAERPLAERNADTDEPGLEETIWIERLSPCHGIVRSVLYQDLGVDYGDVILIDGAPITYHRYGDEEIPVFPHLATLVRQGFQFFDFAATQDASRRVADASRDLDGDAIIYSHSENYKVVCKRCWRDPDIDHENHEEEEKHVVTGRIAVPRHVDAGDFLSQLDAAIESRKPCRVYSPDLCEAAGLNERAKFERRRLETLSNN